MSITARYLFIVTMDVTPEKENFFNELYDTEHAPYVSKVPGVISLTRLKLLRETIFDGPVGATNARYMTIYEIESPDVPHSKEWADAAARGRWRS